ncbi:hypothetical protein AB0K48_02300 [Nonomuraea sp. NPDC055795]
MIDASGAGKENDGVRLLCVPITQPFAEECVRVLRGARDLVGQALTLPPGAELPAAGVFRAETATLAALRASTKQEARQALHSLALDGGNLAWLNAVDHIRALEHDILMQPPPVWSPLSLARAALEGCALTHYLWEGSIGLPLRLARVTSLRVREAQYEAKASAVTWPEGQAAAQARLAEAEQLASAAGAIVEKKTQRSKKVIKGYRVDGAYAPLDFTISERINAFMPSWVPPSSYSLLSGAAHSRPWVINRARTEQPDEWAGEAATVMTAAVIALGALDAALATWSGFFGVNVEAALKDLETMRDQFFRDAIMLAHHDGR